VTVEQSWTRVISWLHDNAPATVAKIRPPAGGDAVAAAEAAFPVSWTSDLREWYALQDGESMEVLWRCVLPHWEILSLDGVVAEAQMWAGIFDGEGDAPAMAGEMAFTFLPEFVPIGDDGCGNSLFVDLRPGPLHGCVTEFSAEDPTGDPSWPSVSGMLEDLADSLESGAECDGWTPSVVEGELSWDLADAD
jgi:cell wall assembly regulator SMI1